MTAAELQSVRHGVEGPGVRGYPRPQLRRARWTCLNGWWDFALDVDPRVLLPNEVDFNRRILVPFAPETERSGINDRGYHHACWYRRRVEVGTLGETQRLMLHFGAVDYEATVFVDGRCVGAHQGGYTPFQLDITDWVRGKADFELCVRVLDDPHDLAKPRGKQDWELEPHSIWYPRTTGIWQTVWMEKVPATHIAVIRWSPSLERWEFGLEVHVAGAERCKGLWLRVRMRTRGMLLVEDRYRVVAAEVQRFLALSDPGIDDFRNSLLWSPESPTLVQVELELIHDDGTVVDRVRSYTALRSVATERGRFVLNGRAYPMRLVLNQGYWPHTGITAPDDHALQTDVRLVKQMGFNGVRMHQKIEDPRFLYWADKMGLLVWEEMPSAYRFTRRSIDRLTREWMSAILRDLSHPCIVVWVPFNESWGVANLPNSAAERHYVQGLYHLTRSLDATRLVVGNDGWETTATDIVGIHDYDADPERIAQRYHLDANPMLLHRERPGGRLLVLEGHSANGAPMVLSEFGGIAFSPDPATWGYTKCHTRRDLIRQFGELMHVVNGLQMFTGYCYTQFSDTYQEANGLLYADRRPKMPMAVIAGAVSATLLVQADAVDLHDSILPEGQQQS
jgi:beta-galactosidase/beta-glucuronidase